MNWAISECNGMEFEIIKKKDMKWIVYYGHT